MTEQNDTGAGNGAFVIDTVGGLSGEESRSRTVLIDFIFSDTAFKTHLKEAAKHSVAFADQAAFLEFCRSQAGAHFGAGDGGGKAIAELDAFIGKSENVSERFKGTLKPNPKAIFWPDPTRGDPLLADVLPVAKRYPFIDQSTRIASAGSCFAVEIAQNLIRRGFNYMCLETTYDEATGTICLGTDSQKPEVQYSCRWGILFNTPSFTQIAENAFGVRPLPELLIEIHDGPVYAFLNPFRESVAFPSVEAYRKERETHLANTRKVFTEADVFVMTLGLNEAWQYTPDGSYISRNPRNAALNGLLDHRTLTVQENIDYLQRFIDVVRAHNPDLKIIITVSPVPFMATGRADTHHVVTANTHSKAVLRVTAEEIVGRNKDVYYFPSYEVVTVCSPEIWTEDQRHIHRDAVQRVMDTFDEMFLIRAARTLAKLSAVG